jgi:hypothetical protein
MEDCSEVLLNEDDGKLKNGAVGLSRSERFNKGPTQKGLRSGLRRQKNKDKEKG